MALADSPKGFRPYFDKEAKVMYFPVAATQTFTVGDAVYLDSGQIKIATNATAILVGVSAGVCAALAENTLVPVWSDPSTFFVGRQDASATIVGGGEYDIAGGTGVQQIDDNVTTREQFKLIAPVSTSEAAGPGKRWIVRINKHAFAQID